MSKLETALREHDLSQLRAVLDQHFTAPEDLVPWIVPLAAQHEASPAMVDLLIERGLRLETPYTQQAMTSALKGIALQLFVANYASYSVDEREDARLRVQRGTAFVTHLCALGATRGWVQADWQACLEGVNISVEALDALQAGGVPFADFGDAMLSSRTGCYDEGLALRLLDLGASATLREKEGGTTGPPIILAAVENGHLALVERLLAGGADANAVSMHDNHTPLIEAAQLRPHARAKALPNSRFAGDLPRLRIAMINLLVAHGGRLDVRTGDGLGVLRYAADARTRAHLQALGVPHEAGLKEFETNVVVIEARDRRIEILFEEGDGEWAELVGSGEAISGVEPSQTRTGSRCVARIVAEHDFAEVLRILEYDAGLINRETMERLRALAERQAGQP